MTPLARFYRALFCAALMSPFALLVLSTLNGMRINRSPSFPIGIYWAVGKEPGRGDLVFFLPPRLPTFELAKTRAYIGRSVDPADGELMLKRIVAVHGDEISIAETGVTVNGAQIPNSIPKALDPAGRTLPVCRLQGYRLSLSEVLLMSDYSALSFDGRYFGPIPSSCIQSVVMPVWTW